MNKPCEKFTLETGPSRDAAHLAAGPMPIAMASRMAPPSIFPEPKQCCAGSAVFMRIAQIDIDSMGESRPVRRPPERGIPGARN